MALREQASRIVARRRARNAAAGSAPFALPDLHATRNHAASGLVGVLVYQGVTTAEIDEPVRRVAAALDADVIHIGVAGSAPTIVGIEPVRIVHIDATINDAIALKADILVIPGGLGWERLVDDLAVMTWLIHAAKSAGGVLAISTGSLLLAAAGRLDGQSATGHWLARDALSALGADVSTDRTAHSQDDRVVTASGAMAAVEVAAELAERVRWGPS